MESLAGLLHPPACHSEPPTDLPGRCSPGSLFGVGQRKPLESRSPKANNARPPARTCWDKAGVGKRGLYLVCFDLQEAHVLCLFFFLCKHCLLYQNGQHEKCLHRGVKRQTEKTNGTAIQEGGMKLSL